MTPFVHLSVHTEYSIVDGMAKVGELAQRARALDMPAVAITDLTRLFGLVKFQDACHAAGVKPIFGADLRFRIDEGHVDRCTVLAMTRSGYAGLLELVSRAWGKDGHAGLVRREWILDKADGLIVLSGADSDVGRTLVGGDLERAAALADDWTGAFGDRFYLAARRTGRAGEDEHLAAAVELAARRGLPVAATNDVRFLRAEDFEAHETRVCIQDGRTLDDPRRPRAYTPQQYLRSPAEMAELFADLPEALENTAEIAMRCNLELALGAYHLPNYPTPAGESLETLLDTSAAGGLDERLAALPADGAPDDAANGAGTADRAAYRARLDYELGVIKQMGFAGYYLIVAEFVNWAKEHGVPVGPGRGSGAGSLVAWALGITDIDPIAYDLIFERFLNAERVSMPDFDVDFCMAGRDAVIGHVAERYGAASVGQIATFGTMAARAVVRDVARVQGKPHGLADRVAKMIPFELGMTLAAAAAQEPELREFIDENDAVAEIWEMATKLEGVVRNVGLHAGGVVIAPSRLMDFVPLYQADGGVMSQFDKDDVERAGLVKFDFLGLRTLTIIDLAQKAVNAARTARGEAPIDFAALPKDDPETFAMLCTGQTTGIFQLESSGMQELIRRLQPDSIHDIIALVALYRPGPLESGAVDDYIDRKHGRAPVSYPHPRLEGALKNTYGVMLYQEQVMSAAQSLAGFSLGQADLLRRAMGKKKPEEMAKVRQQYMDGAHAQGVDAGVAASVFDQMEKFAGYAFVKGHATAYGLVTFQTAWLKTHHPAAFMAAVLSANMGDRIEKVVGLVDEVRRMEIALHPPNVNQSELGFKAVAGAAGDEILYGLGAVREVGAGAVGLIVAERDAGGAFEDLEDLCRRVDTARVNKAVLEALIRSGALDCLGDAGESIDAVRAHLWEQVPDALLGAEQTARDTALGVTDMFGGATAPSVQETVRESPRPWTRRERLAAEKRALGLYLTGHPIDDHVGELERFRVRRLAKLKPDRKLQRVAGVVVSYRTRRGAMGFAELDDQSGRVEASVFGETFRANRAKLAKDAVLIFEGEVQEDDRSGGLRLRAKSIHTIEEARARFARVIKLSIERDAMDADLGEHLAGLLEPHRGNGAPDDAPRCPVVLAYRCLQGEAELTLGDAWRVAPTDNLLAALRGAFGTECVEVAYAAA